MDAPLKQGGRRSSRPQIVGDCLIAALAQKRAAPKLYLAPSLPQEITTAQLPCSYQETDPDRVPARSRSFILRCFDFGKCEGIQSLARPL